MRAAKLIIWDEAPRQRHQAHTSASRMLHNICGYCNPAAAHMDFGGRVSVQAPMTLCCMCRTCSICFHSGLGVCLGCVPDLGVALLDGWACLQVMELGGDFRQILPVVPRGPSGQTLEKVGILLPKVTFSRGQLYVAMSRVGARNRLCIQVLGGGRQGHDGVFTRNIVYPEALL